MYDDYSVTDKAIFWVIAGIGGVLAGAFMLALISGMLAVVAVFYKFIAWILGF